MASEDNGGVQETNLDEVEIDEDGNLTFPDSSADGTDQDEQDTGAIDVDEDGNLRIQSASRLLSEFNDAENPAAERRENFKRRRSEHGTVEEETEMTSVRNQRPLIGRRRSFNLAMDSWQAEDLCGRRYSGPLTPVSGHQLQDIELTVFNRPTPEQGVESHQPVTSAHSVERGDSGQDQQHKKGVGRVLDIVGHHLSTSSMQRLAIIGAAAVIVIGILLTVSLVPASFVYVEYYELALSKNRVSGKVNRQDAYHPGCYLLTPDTELVRFQGTAHHVEQTLQAVTSDGLMFDMAISLQYFIKPEELGQLFTDYTHNYRPVVESMIESTLHAVGADFTLDHFRLNRSHVEQTLRQAVALKLGGNCCPSCCPFSCSAGVDCRSCRLAGRGCSRGIHMEMRFFQMGAVRIPEEVSERFLRQTVLLIEEEKEFFLQLHALATKKSEQMQKDVLNRAAELREAASAEAKKIRSIAAADYEKRVQTAYAAALKKFYQRLNITQEDHKLSLMYIRALEDMSDNLYNLNYDTLTTYD